MPSPPEFGIIGGHGHESVRRAATRFVAAAQDHFDVATPTTSCPYPAAGAVRFYQLGYGGVRFVQGLLDPIESGTAPLSPLFGTGQAVLTELRQVTEAGT